MQPHYGHSANKHANSFIASRLELLQLLGAPLPTMHFVTNFQKCPGDLPDLFVNKWIVYDEVHFKFVHLEGRDSVA